MTLSFCVLGSGSAGNCTLVSLHGPGEGRHMLIDAGLSPRRTAHRLGPLGIGLDQVSDVLLTHIDADHFHPGWVEQRTWRFTWRTHRRHLDGARMAGLPLGFIEPFDERFEPGPGTSVETMLLPHDQLGTVGYVIDHEGARLGYATDLGRVPPTFLKRFSRLDALAIESNYDLPLQAASDRPAALKSRIMGGLGHLSNEQSLEAVLRIAGVCDLRHIVLLHLSRHCNDPDLVRRLYARRAPHLLSRLTITNQWAPTPVLAVDGPRPQPLPAVAGRQLNFLETLGEPSWPPTLAPR